MDFKEVPREPDSSNPPSYWKSHFLHVDIDELCLVAFSRRVQSVCEVKNFVTPLQGTAAMEK